MPAPSRSPLDLSTATARLWLVFLLLLGAWLRLSKLTALGLEHDEVANWLIDRSIINGNHGIYFSEAYGHEAGFHYLQTLFVMLIGDNALALRLPAALLGVVLLAVSYTLVKTLYNRPIALIATAILAITFFPIFYSRLALRAMMLPVFSGLAATFFWRGVKRRDDSLSPFFFAALFAGLSTYTYMASRVVPIFFFGWMIVSIILNRGRDSQSNASPASRFEMATTVRQWGVFWGIYALISAPLYLYLQFNPAAEFRVTEINAPLEAARNGDLSLIWQNIKLVFGVWGWSGDPLWRQNVSGMPIFGPMVAILFYSGAALALWRRKRADFFCLLWIATATIPSLVTTDAPSTIRMINLLPLLGVLPARVIHTLSIISTKNRGLSTTFWQIPWISYLILSCIWASSQSVHAIQTVWPNGGDVPFVWQTSLTSAARWLDGQTPQPTTIIGWTPDTMDPPTMTLAMRQDGVPLRFASPDAVVLPAGDQVRVIRPKTPNLPLPPSLEAQLAQWDATTLEAAHFTVYSVRWTPEHLTNPLNLHVGNELTLLGHGRCPQADEWCSIATVWQINAPISEPRSVFIHLLNDAGELVSQSDVQLSGAHSWQAGDLLFVSHQFNAAANTNATVGAYHSQTWQRLPLEDGRDSAEIDLLHKQP
ncbi:MAG: ArnT family glycosyltransferase [Candidatus Promineifilaceae bacterium]